MDNITIDKANENVKSNKRIEKDKLGKVAIDKDLLYGIEFFDSSSRRARTSSWA